MSCDSRESPTTGLCSFPKSGRTWLRFLLANYLVSVLELELELDLKSMFRLIPNAGASPLKGLPAYGFGDRSDVPRLVCDHALPGRISYERVVLLLRHPGDILLSFYHHSRHWRRSAYGGSLDRFLADERRGMPALARYLNSWAESLPELPSFVVTYERLRSATRATMAEIVDFLELPLREAAVESAVEAASFDQMAQLERTGGLPGSRRSDPGLEEARIRRGTTGEHRSRLEPRQKELLRTLYLEQATSATRSLLAEHGIEPGASSSGL